MPDGSMEVLTTQHHAFPIMYARLIDYGLCYLRGGRGLNQQIIKWESDVRPEYREWSRPEIEAAARLHSVIIRLPMQHNLVLQVFFNEACAAVWDQYDPDKQRAIVRDLTLWPARPAGVNARINAANSACHTKVPSINPAQFIPIRDRAIQMLCNIQAVQPAQDVEKKIQTAPIFSRNRLTTETD